MSDTGYNAEKWAFLYGVLRSNTSRFFRYIDGVCNHSDVISFSLYILALRKEDDEEDKIIQIQPLESDYGELPYNNVGADEFNTFVRTKEAEFDELFEEKANRFSVGGWEAKEDFSTTFKNEIKKTIKDFSVVEAIRNFSPNNDKQKLFVSRGISDGKYDIHICISIDKIHFFEFDLQEQANIFPLGDTKSVSFLKSILEGYLTRIAKKLMLDIDFLNDLIWEEHRKELWQIDGQSFDDILTNAARSFMTKVVQITTKNTNPPTYIRNNHNPKLFDKLFDACNYVASMNYEHKECNGKVLLTSGGDYLSIRLRTPFQFRESRKVRKMLEITDNQNYLIADHLFIHGVSSSPNIQDKFIIEFTGMNSWRLIFNQTVLLHVKSGIPIEINPYDVKIKESIDKYSAMFPQTEFNEINLSELLKAFIKYMIEERNGGIIVISLDAQEEAYRLSSNSFKIEDPPKLTTENINLFSNLAKIDGAILLDEVLNCHAFGVILDGDKTDKASLSRGARYNSALRYVENKQPNRVLAIVISVDGMIDVFTKNEEVPTSL
ncbi:MAG TPA: diadenylate cyclase [Candidatus Kapabacteria bacterium]|jgi:hypothetical protein|nr:diadenylate cyclase [Candidatus Kapabacteria bacterium]